MISLNLGNPPVDRRESRAIDSGSFPSELLGPPTAAGVSVTQESAKSLSAYWNGVCVISGDIGAMDRHIYRRVGEDDRERATTLPAYKLVHDQPNPQATGMVFWETFASHVVSWGNGYAEIEFDNAMRPIGLWLITPDKMEPMVETLIDRRGRVAQRVYYVYRGQTRLEAEDVLHVPGLGFDGIRGYSPVALARQSLGLALAMERYGASFYGNGAWPGIALEVPPGFSDAARANLRASVEQIHRGTGKSHRVMLLEDGVKATKPITVPPDDAQFLQGREFSVEEIARWLNLPPHKLKHKMGDRPGGNLESSEIDYQVTTLLPITKRIEQECDRKLLGGSRQYYTEHNFATRLKPDTTTRMSSYKTLHDLGAMDAEQIARAENLPRPKPQPIPAPAPDPAPPPPPAEPPAPRDAARIDVARRTLLLSVVNRFMRREAEQARRAADRGPDAFGKWVEKYYGEAERALLVESVEPALGLVVVATGSQVDPRAAAEGFAGRYLARSREEMEALPQRTVGTAVPSLIKRWETARALESVEELIAACEAAEEREHVA